MPNTQIIVVGASAGGVEALKQLITSLPKDFSGYIFIVLHIPAYSPSSLPSILGRCNVLPVVHPQDGQVLVPGTIYVALPDHHLLIEKRTVLVKKGPKENRFRPSIDALFRSAAYTFGSRVIGIILSGTLDDGTSGMWSIKRLGGTTMVQLPSEASHPEMPMNVMEFVQVDYCVPISEMSGLIIKMQHKQFLKKEKATKAEIKMLEMEITISKQDNAFSLGIINQGNLTSFTCPECHGALVRLVEGKIIRFRCHTGHAFTASALLAGLTQNIEESLWASMRAMEECTMLLENLKNDYKKIGHVKASAFFRKAEVENRDRARIIHDSVFTQKILSSDFRFSGKDHETDLVLPKKTRNSKKLDS